MYPIRTLLSGALALAVISSAAAAVGYNARVENGVRTIDMAESSDTIANPQRGFSIHAELFGDGDFMRLGRRGATLIRANGRLDDYREQDLPETLLETFDRRLDEARSVGMKVTLRFAYNNGPYPDAEPDAPLEWVMRHIEQLKPYLQKHADVIAWMEAGFIGAWGEWHSSTNGLDRSPAAKRAVLAALVDALPAPRQVLLRYPVDLAHFNRLGDSTIDHRRLGLHNDCFLASETDGGTYERGRRSADQEKQLVAAHGRIAPIGGESCAVNPPRTDCPTALAELERLGFTELNRGYHPGVLEGWREGGCFDTIEQRLGYRLWAEQVSLPATLVPGEAAAFKISIRNSGFAPPVDERRAYLVLDGPSRQVIELPHDPRTWLPGESHLVDIDARLIDRLRPGRYRLALWLPDPSPALQHDARFAIRLANDGGWDAATGFNTLVGDVTVARRRATGIAAP